MRRSFLLLALIFLGLLAAMAAASLLERAPPLRVQNAPGQFDAVRAKARLAFILGDQKVHPADSGGDDGVRSRLIAALRQAGLNPVVRDQFACNELFKERGVSCTRVRNVIATIGPATGKALLLNTHYDSTEVGPAAADDGIGVATLIEVGAILKERRLKRPVILLFNEGEELGLVGARAFLADPLSRNVDSLINLEARGVEGPVNMFETSRPNAAPVSLFAAAVARPTANSLSTDIYRLMPNYTDVNSFAERGWLTLNLAPIGNETRYHSAGDDLAALSPVTLQHMGDQTLALAEKLSDGAPQQASSNRIFMDVAGRFLIAMPLAVGGLLLAGILIAFAGLFIARGAGMRSVAVALGTLVGSGVIAWLALAIVGAVRGGMFWRAHPQWTHLATYAGILLVGAVLVATVGRQASRRQLRTAFWLMSAIIGMMIGLFAPGGIVFFLFPPLAVLAGVVGARWWKPAEQVGSLAAIAILYFTWGGMLGLLEELLNGGPMWLFAPLASLLFLPALIEARTVIDAIELRLAAGLSSALVLAGWAAAAAAPAYSADRQQRFVIQHITDASARKSWWSILNDHGPLPRGFGAGWMHGKLPLGDGVRWFKPTAGDASAKAPTLDLISEVRIGNQRTLTLRLHANGADDIDLVAPEDAKVRSAGVQGFVRPIDQDQDGKYYISCSGRSCDGAMLELTTDRASRIPFLIVGSRIGLPVAARPLTVARPQFARPQYNPDASIAFTRTSL